MSEYKTPVEYLYQQIESLREKMSPQFMSKADDLKRLFERAMNGKATGYESTPNYFENMSISLNSDQTNFLYRYLNDKKKENVQESHLNYLLDSHINFTLLSKIAKNYAFIIKENSNKSV